MNKHYFWLVLLAAVLMAPGAYAQVDIEAEPLFSADSPSGADDDLAVVFKGVSSATGFDSEGALDIVEGPITMECWIKPEAFNDFNGLINVGFSYKLGVNFNSDINNLVFTFYGVVDIFSGVNIEADSTWKHVASVWEPGVGVTFYVDGEEAAFVEQTGAPRELQNSNITVGAEINGVVPFVGAMDRVRIHNAVLTADELDSVADAPKGPLDSTLVHYGFDTGSFPVPSLGSAGIDLLANNAAGVSTADSWEIYN